MACMPDGDCDYINNVIIGCHVTITSNKECPSRYSDEGSWDSDVSMLMNHASSGLVIHSSQWDMPYYNLVILPDYEGYGATRAHAHPYLYQELTARQVVDATRYGISLYKTDSKVNKVRHPFRDGWRSICVGYSQGGSVALATQRFIEQNGLTDELHLGGSVCGDGPYDMMATTTMSPSRGVWPKTILTMSPSSMPRSIIELPFTLTIDSRYIDMNAFGTSTMSGGMSLGSSGLPACTDSYRGIGVSHSCGCHPAFSSRASIALSSSSVIA